ncbi:hypothetical protein IWW48_000676 [Coemansia sp. RSA 1200]|nr:hypothetical protein IWW48_000676 [Coemansia sp. RSA 1200]
MNGMESENDDFFSELCALRRQFGMSKHIPFNNNKSPQEHSEYKSAETVNNTDQSLKQGRKRTTVLSTDSSERESKRCNSSKANGIVSHIIADPSKSSHSLGSVSPGEIAALLSSRQQKRKMGSRSASKRRSSGIPPRTPESRIASPQALLLTQNSTPISMSTPTKKPVVLTPQIAAKEGDTPTTTSTSPSSASSSVFNMRRFWSKGNTATPMYTTPTGQRHCSLPADKSKESSSGEFKGLLAFRLDSPKEAGNKANNGFGLLGSVEEALITEADLEASRRKLGEEYALTQQQIIRDIRDRLMGFACSSFMFLDATEWRESVSLLCQFYTLGHGRFAFAKQGIMWEGHMLGPIASVLQEPDSIGRRNSTNNDSDATTVASLLFPWNRVTLLRRKDIDDGCFVMATVDDDLGVAFKMGDQAHVSSSEIDTVVARMGVFLSDALRSENIRRFHEPSSTLVSPQPAEVASSRYPNTNSNSFKGTDVIRSALEFAKTHDKRFIGLDISALLSKKEFMTDAISSALEFSLALATRADSLAHSISGLNSLVDDPGTETLPGTCTLCYAEAESVVFQPCNHKVCKSCFSHLREMYPSSSQQANGDCSSDTACICPWDRTGIDSWFYA